MLLPSSLSLSLSIVISLSVCTLTRMHLQSRPERACVSKKSPRQNEKERESSQSCICSVKRATRLSVVESVLSLSSSVRSVLLTAAGPAAATGTWPSTGDDTPDVGSDRVSGGADPRNASDCSGACGCDGGEFSRASGPGGGGVVGCDSARGRWLYRAAA